MKTAKQVEKILKSLIPNYFVDIKVEQIKAQKQIQQQTHEEVFGDCTEDFEEEYLRMESNYACGRH